MNVKAPAVHQWNDVPLGNSLRRLEIRRQERAGDPPRQLRVILVNNSDRGVMHFLRIALRVMITAKVKA